MTTSPAPLHAVPTTSGRQARLERRLTEIETLWGEAMELRALGDRASLVEADELFREANVLGASFPTDESRVDALTGHIPLGFARVPGTRFDADVALSHGSDESGRTSLDRYTGVGGKAERNRLELVADSKYVFARFARADGGAKPVGAEGALARLGAKAGDSLVVEFLEDGRLAVSKEVVPAPKPVED